MRPLDAGKIKKILSCLKKHSLGTYVSEISRETGLSKSTVSFLLNTHLKNKIEEIIVGKKGLFKIVRLKT